MELKRGKWSEDEVSILKKYYPIGGYTLCIKNGLKRDENSIRNKVSDLKLKVLPKEKVVKSLSDREIAILKKYYPIGGYLLCLNNGLLNEDKGLIKQTIIELGLNRTKANSDLLSDELWSEKEMRLLCKYYPIGGTYLCLKKGLNRECSAIKSKANINGLHTNIRGSGVLWEKWEDEIIAQYYPIYGSRFCIDMGLNRGIDTIRNRAYKLGYRKLDYDANSINNPKAYAKWEEDIIKKYYPIGGTKECKKRGLNRTDVAIILKAERMGLRVENKLVKKRDWSTKELDILKKYYPDYGVEGCVSNGLNRSEYAIKHKVTELGLKINKSDEWTNEEITILKKYYPIYGINGCIERGLKRTECAIYIKIRQLGLKREDGSVYDGGWTAIERDILINNYPLYGSKGCIDAGINRTEKAIVRKASELGIKREKRGDWLRREDELLKTYYPAGGYELCVAKGLNKQIQSVRNRAKFWGLEYKK